ncbi:MAG: hypothetical protein AAFR67_13245 [Chloroflexota bacterium]
MGCWDDQNTVISTITPRTFDAIASHLGGSGGVDVTGGMYTKVKDVLSLASNPPYPMVQILNGMIEGRLQSALSGVDVLGTMIHN